MILARWYFDCQFIAACPTLSDWGRTPWGQPRLQLNQVQAPYGKQDIRPERLTLPVPPQTAWICWLRPLECGCCRNTIFAPQSCTCTESEHHLCQHNASKFDIVQRCCGVLVWTPWPKDDILPVLLNEAADIVEGLPEAVPSKLPNQQAGHLKGYVNHVLRPCWKSNHPEWYEEMYRRQCPNLVENGDAVCAAVTALEFKWCNELGCIHRVVCM